MTKALLNGLLAIGLGLVIVTGGFAAGSAPGKTDPAISTKTGRDFVKTLISKDHFKDFLVGGLPTGMGDTAATAIGLGGSNASEIYVLGGTKSRLVLTGSSPDKLRAVAKLPATISQGAAFGFGRYHAVYLIGGNVDGKPVNQILELNTDTNQLYNDGPFIEPLSEATEVQGQGAHYLVGGWNGEKLATAIIRFYSPSRIRVMARLPVGTRAAAAALYGGNIMYVAGGITKNGMTANVYKVYLLTGKVQYIGKLPRPVSHAMMVYSHGMLYVLGGIVQRPHSKSRNVASAQAKEPKKVSTIVQINPNTGKTKNAGNMQWALANVQAVRFGRGVLAVDGANRNSFTLALRFAPGKGTPLLGPPGPTGPAGSAGPTGPAGANGKQGDKGATGKAGKLGPTGASGAKGATGAGGAQGPAGVQGPAGAQGLRGPTGGGGGSCSDCFLTDPSSTQTVTYGGAGVQTIFKEAAGQSASPIDVQNSSGGSLFTIGTTGGFTAQGNSVINGSLTTDLGLGVVHSNSSGLLSSSLIVDADVASNAAISGSKINPAFGAQNVSTTGGGTITSNGLLTASNGLTVGAGTTTLSALGQGVVHSSSSGVLSSSTIVDADVASNAAIAGTKISPNFGTQAVTTSGNVSTTGSGTITSAGLLTASNALTVSSGNLTISPFGTSGIVHNNSSGVLTSSLIADADVASSAAIAGSKISPDFGSQNVTTSGNVSTTGSGTVTSAGLLTASNGLTVSAGNTTLSGLGAGVVHSDSSGKLTSSTIVDADVASNAAIAGTKISPDFGSQNVTTSGNISSTGSGTITSAGLLTASNGLTVTSGETITAGGLTVTAGGATITAGGLTVNGGGASIAGDIKQTSTGVNTWVTGTPTPYDLTSATETVTTTDMLTNRLVVVSDAAHPLTLPQASTIEDAIPNVAVGDTFEFTIENADQNGDNIFFLTDSDTTLEDTGFLVPDDTNVQVVCRVTATSPAAVTCY